MKKLFLMVPVALLAVFVVASCNHGFKLSDAQQKVYDAWIDSTFVAVTAVEMSADAVKKLVETANTGFKPSGFVIEDTQDGNPIKQGTSKEDLKKRFPPKKA